MRIFFISISFIIGILVGILFSKASQLISFTKKSYLDLPSSLNNTKDVVSIETETLADKLYKRVRILCWIMTQPKSHDWKALIVNRTWAPRCNKYIFVTSVKSPANSTSANLPFVEINVPENRGTLWAKTRGALEYVHKHYLNDFDFFMKADDDTYLIVENLRFFLMNVPNSTPMVAGRHFKAYVKQGYLSGGAGYVMSREALRRVVTVAFKNNSVEVCMPITDMGPEDIHIGKCLESVGVKVMSSLDSSGGERFHPFDLAYHIFMFESPPDFWYFSYNKHPIKYGLDCCSDYAISFHYIYPDLMKNMDYLIYKLRPFGLTKNCYLDERAVKKFRLLI